MVQANRLSLLRTKSYVYVPTVKRNYWYVAKLQKSVLQYITDHITITSHKSYNIIKNHSTQHCNQIAATYVRTLHYSNIAFFAAYCMCMLSSSLRYIHTYVHIGYL